MERPSRKQNRLKDYDYSRAGAYFITVCTHNRECLLSYVGDGSPVPQLMPSGIAADECITALAEKYPTASVPAHVIMPNHIQLLLMLSSASGTENPSSTTGNIIGWLKYRITKQVNTQSDGSCARLFQRSYHDHVIRNEADYQKILKYISENPLKWKDDCFYIG